VRIFVRMRSKFIKLYKCTIVAFIIKRRWRIVKCFLSYYNFIFFLAVCVLIEAEKYSHICKDIFN
jgi:hypothetical protein